MRRLVAYGDADGDAHRPLRIGLGLGQPSDDGGLYVHLVDTGRKRQGAMPRRGLLPRRVLCTAFDDPLLSVEPVRAQCGPSHLEMVDLRGADALTDLIAAHPRSGELIEAYVGTMMLNYQIGFLAGRTRPNDAISARAEAGRLGRMLRDRWRSLGLPVEDAGMNVGVVVDATLLRIVDMGLDDARQESP